MCDGQETSTVPANYQSCEAAHLESQQAHYVGHDAELDEFQQGVVDAQREQAGLSLEELGEVGSTEAKAPRVNASVSQLYGLASQVLRTVLKGVLEEDYQPILDSTREAIRMTIPADNPWAYLAKFTAEMALAYVAALELVAEQSMQAELVSHSAADAANS